MRVPYAVQHSRRLCLLSLALARSFSTSAYVQHAFYIRRNGSGKRRLARMDAYMHACMCVHTVNSAPVHL